MKDRKPRFYLLPFAFCLFVVLATLNSAGYRYGASDQAFYIPAVTRQLDPALFPRDRALIDAQARLITNVLDAPGTPSAPNASL